MAAAEHRHAAHIDPAVVTCIRAADPAANLDASSSEHHDRDSDNHWEVVQRSQTFDGDQGLGTLAFPAG